MIAPLGVIFLIAAVICFAFGAFFGLFVGEPSRWGRFSPMALGLFFYALKDLFHGA